MNLTTYSTRILVVATPLSPKFSSISPLPPYSTLTPPAHAQLVDSAETKSKVVPKKKNAVGGGPWATTHL